MTHHPTTRSLRLPLFLGALFLAVGLAPDSARAQGQMPFSDYQGRRGLSPYAALGFQGDNPLTGSTLGAYQNIVRPQQLQAAQLRQSQQQGRQLNQMQGQMRAMKRSGSNPTTDTIRATGHSATFLNTSHFYPSAR